MFVGHLVEGQTSLMRMNSLRRNGLRVSGFDTRTIWNSQSWLRRQASTRLERGPAVDQINNGIIELARQCTPEFIWFDKQEFILPETMSELRNLGARLIYYTPDPYFTLQWKQTRLMGACLPEFDLLITSKTYELDRFRQVGPPVMYLPLGYCEETHRPIDVPESEHVSIGFVGGWEPRRQEILESIAGQGVSVKIWGYAWDHLIDGSWSLRRYMRLRRLAGKDNWSLRESQPLKNCIVSGEVYGDEYSAALSASRISLGFLRTTWPDQHTTRTFEIPACGSMLLADRTKEHQEFFREGVEADYFSSTEELVEKAVFYHRNEGVRSKIALAGHHRCLSSGLFVYGPNAFRDSRSRRNLAVVVKSSSDSRRPSVVFFQRKRRTGRNYSLEQIFDDLRNRLESEFKCILWIAPYLSNGLFRRLAIMWSAFWSQGDVNHVTGDINFVTVPLRRHRTVLTILDCGVLNRNVRNKTLPDSLAVVSNSSITLEHRDCDFQFNAGPSAQGGAVPDDSNPSSSGCNL